MKAVLPDRMNLGCIVAGQDHDRYGKSMTLKPVPGIKKILGALRIEAEKRNIEFDAQLEDALKQFVTTRVNEGAEALGITVQGFMATYKNQLKPDEIMDVMFKAMAHRAAEMLGPPVTISLHDVGRVVASLCQAARMVSLNYDEPEDHLDADAQAVLDGVGDGGAVVGLAIVQAAQTGATDVTVSGEGVGLIRQALSTVIEQFAAGNWTTGNPQTDVALQKGMAADLALVDRS